MIQFGNVVKYFHPLRQATMTTDAMRVIPFPSIYFSSRDVTNFINRSGSWEKMVKPDVLKVVSHYKNRTLLESNSSMQRFGIMGFCWGGKMAALAISDPETTSSIHAAALIHPSLLISTDARKVKGHMIVLPSKHEPNLVRQPFRKNLFSFYDFWKLVYLTFDSGSILLNNK
jgi:dienelactone hydrolase